MAENMFTERLEEFRANESPEVVLLIADETELIRLCIAWTNTAVTIKPELSELEDDSSQSVWQWLWANTEYERRKLLTKSNVSEYGLERRMEFLVGNRILYPDGTINSFVQRYLRDRVLKSFETKPKRPAKSRK